MKKIGLFLTLVTIFSCCKNNGDIPTAPIDLLPLAIQVDANTGGCLVNGEAIYPKGSGLILNFFYTDGKNLGLFIKNENNDKDRVINIASLGEVLQVNKTYQLAEKGTNTKSGEYIINTEPSPSTNYYSTTPSITGELTITHHDFDNAFLSGTFWFDAIKQWRS